MLVSHGAIFRVPKPRYLFPSVVPLDFGTGFYVVPENEELLSQIWAANCTLCWEIGIDCKLEIYVFTHASCNTEAL